MDEDERYLAEKHLQEDLEEPEDPIFDFSTESIGWGELGSRFENLAK